MPQTRVTSPEGETYLVNHPDGATEEDIFAYVKRTYGVSEELPVEPPEDPALSLSRPEDDPFPEGVDIYPDPARMPAGMGRDILSAFQTHQADLKDSQNQLSDYNTTRFAEELDIPVEEIENQIFYDIDNIKASVARGDMSSDQA